MTLAFGLVMAPAGASGGCEILAEGAPTQELDCTRAALWAVRCRVPPAGKRRMRLEVPEWGVEAETRLPLATGEQFEVTLLGPNGARGNAALDGLRPQLSNQFVSALPLCRSGVPPGTLRVSVTEHQPMGFAQEIDENGVITSVPTYGKGTIVATAQATVTPAGTASTVPARTSSPVRGKLSVRRGDSWVDLRWEGAALTVPVATGPVALLRLDFPAAQVEEALGPGDAATLLAQDLVRWLSGDATSQLGLVAFRRSGIPVPIAEVPTFTGSPQGLEGWRRARGGTTAFAVGPMDEQTVRVALAFRSIPLDSAADEALRTEWAVARP